MVPASTRIAGYICACVVGVSSLAGPALADTVDPATTTPGTTTTSTTTAGTAESTPTTSTSESTATTVVPAADADASAAVPPPTDLAEAAVVSRVATGSRLAVGDSILVGATPLMRRHGFAIHAKVGRQFSTARGIVRAYGGALPRNVVIELGTNGTVSLATCRAVVRAAGPHRRVFLVTNRVPRSWEDSNNTTLRACDANFRAARVRIVDWHAASAGRSDWFAADGVHPSPAGRAAFTRLVDRAVDRYGL